MNMKNIINMRVQGTNTTDKQGSEAFIRQSFIIRTPINHGDRSIAPKSMIY